jgi:chromosome segregation ATPase
LVKHVLADNGNVTTAFLGGAALAENWERLFHEQREAGPGVLWTPEANYRRTLSAYNKSAQSVTVRPVGEAMLFRRGGSALGDSEKERLQSEIGAQEAEMERYTRQRHELHEQTKELESRKAEKEREKKKADAAAMANRNKRVTLETRIKSKKSELARKKRSKDPREDEPRLGAELETLRRGAVTAAVKLVQLRVAQADAIKKLAVADLAVKEVNDQVERMTAANKERADRVKAMQAAVASFESGVKGLKETALAKQRAAKEVVKLTDEVKAWLETLPEGVAELQALIDAKVRCGLIRGVG